MEPLIPIFMFISIAAVMILRPISKRLGYLLEAMARQRQQPQTDSSDLARIRSIVEQMAQRVELMEERLDFTERLLSSSPRRPGIGATAFDALSRERESEYLRG